jgi:hypothetical protein
MDSALVLFSGGKDSFYLTLLMLEKGYKVKLVTFENGCGLKSENAIQTANRIKEKYGNNKVEILNIQKIEAIWRDFLNLFYNKKTSEILKEYGEITISQFNCLSCRLSMYVMSIILCNKMNMKLVVDGARNNQLFAIEQDLLLTRFKAFFAKYHIKIDFPLKNFKDNFELKNQLLIRGFIPKTLEPQCLLGMPISKKDITTEIIESSAKVFDKLLLKKANELVEKYKNINISGEYI